MHKITPFLWFDHEAEQVAHLDVSIFKNSRIRSDIEALRRAYGGTR